MINNWLIFQLAIDAALLVAIVLLALRDGKTAPDMENRRPDTVERVPMAGLNPVEIETLIEELAKLVARAERAADRLEKGITATGSGAPDSVSKTPSKPEPRSVRPDSGSILGDEPYVKAARLIRKGMADEEVGRKVGLPSHEVGLIRKMMT